jgi:hypothetical protein
MHYALNGPKWRWRLKINVEKILTIAIPTFGVKVVYYHHWFE